MWLLTKWSDNLASYPAAFSYDLIGWLDASLHEQAFIFPFVFI